MSLSEIQKKLYQKEADKDLSKHEQSEYDARAAFEKAKNENFQQKGDVWEEKKPELVEEKSKAYRWGAIAIVSIIILAGILFGIYKWKEVSFSEENTIVSISGPTEIASGKLLTYEITYKNDNWITLKNPVLRISYPENFSPEDDPNFTPDSQTGGTFNLQDLGMKKEGKIIFKGKAYNPKGALVYIKADLSYSPSGFSSKFVASSQIGINVVSSPIVLEIMSPQSLSNSDALDYAISYKNIGNEDYSNIRIKTEYPLGFTFSKSNPEPSEGDNIFYIGHLSAVQEGKIEISGKLEGVNDEVKVARVYVGEFSEGEFVVHNDEKSETKIQSSVLEIHQTVNNLEKLNVDAGQLLLFKISYKNNGNIGLRDVIVTEKLDSPVIDYSKLELKKGAFDYNNKTITWKASDYPQLKFLEPGQSGEIIFNANVKNVIPIESANDKNFVISSIAKIDSPDVPTPIGSNKIVAGNKMDMKLNSKLVIDVKGYYNDSKISNSGPIPPTVNQETTYTLHWLVRNVSNDVSNVKVESTLPTGVSFTGNLYPEDAKFSYNERTNSIVWEIGNLNAGDGILNDPKELIFQIKVIPAPSQAGDKIDLINASKITARDLFTGEDISAEAKAKTTLLNEDSGLKSDAYKVNAE